MTIKTSSKYIKAKKKVNTKISTELIPTERYVIGRHGYEIPIEFVESNK